jgi:uncharacterized caspase-like protein
VCRHTLLLCLALLPVIVTTAWSAPDSPATATPAQGGTLSRGFYMPVRDMSTTLVASDGTTQKGDKWALLIGCNGYDPNEVGPLEVAVADAQRMRDTLIQNAGFAADKVILLTDEGLQTDTGLFPDKRPTYTTLRGQIAKFVRAHKASDVLTVFFAGHGFHSKKTGRDYLAPLDVQRADLDHTAIAVDELLDQLRESGARQCVLIADACRNVVGRAVPGEDTGVGDSSLSAAEARGIWYLSSCSAGQTSQEDATLGGGVFTYYFSEGLQGAADGFDAARKDGYVTVTEAQGYAAAKVEAWSRARGADIQLPCRSERDVSGGEMVLSTPGIVVIVPPAGPVQTPPVARTATGLTLPFKGNLLGDAGQSPLTASGVTFTDGPAGQAAVFEAGNDVTYTSANSISATAGTLMFWIRPQWRGDDGRDHYALCWGRDGGMVFGKDEGGNWRMIVNRYSREQGAAVWLGQEWEASVWHHTAFTWDETALRVYVDGRLGQECALLEPLPRISAPAFQLGGYDGTGNLEAALCDLRIVCRALSAGEIAAVAGRRGGALVPADPPAATDQPWSRPGSQAGEEITGPDGGMYVWVPPGEFMMGNDDGSDDAEPVRPVRITEGFWLGKCEVTNA